MNQVWNVMSSTADVLTVAVVGTSWVRAIALRLRTRSDAGPGER